MLLSFFVLVLFCSTASAAVTVYMMDASEIEAQSAWIEKETVFIQVNPDLRLTFPAAEVDLRKSNLEQATKKTTTPEGKPGNKPDAKPGTKPDPVTARKGGTQALLDELGEVVGFRRDLEDLFRTHLTDDMDRIIDKNFNPAVAERTVKRHLGRKLSTRELQEVLAWFKSRLGKRVLELDSVWDFNRKEKMNTYVGRDTAPGFKERQELVSQIEKTTGTAAVQMRMVEYMYRRLLHAIPPNLPEGKVIKERIQTLLPTLDTLRKQTVTGWLYVYRDLSTGELRDYLRFVRSTSGRKYFTSTNEALEEVFREMAINLEKNLHNDLKMLL